MHYTNQVIISGLTLIPLQGQGEIKVPASPWLEACVYRVNVNVQSPCIPPVLVFPYKKYIP